MKTQRLCQCHSKCFMTSRQFDMKHLGFFYKPVCPIQTEVVNIIIAVKILFQSSFSHNIDVLECISSVATLNFLELQLLFILTLWLLTRLWQQHWEVNELVFTSQNKCALLAAPVSWRLANVWLMLVSRGTATVLLTVGNFTTAYCETINHFKILSYPEDIKQT